MKKIGLVIVLGSVLFLAACGTEDEGTIKNIDNGQYPVNPNGKYSGIVAGDMMSQLKDLGNGKFEYVLKNQTEKEMKFDFTSSQRYDYSIKDKDGKEVYLFSSVSMFMQALGTETVKQGEELKYSLNLNEAGLQKGEYTVEVWLTAKSNENYKAIMTYKVE